MNYQEAIKELKKSSKVSFTSLGKDYVFTWELTKDKNLKCGTVKIGSEKVKELETPTDFIIALKGAFREEKKKK